MRNEKYGILKKVDETGVYTERGDETKKVFSLLDEDKNEEGHDVPKLKKIVLIWGPDDYETETVFE